MGTFESWRWSAGRAGTDRRPGPQLVYSDLDLFRNAVEAVLVGTPRLEAFGRYLSEGSPGLKAYARVYDVTPDRYADRLDSHPNYFQELAGIGERVVAGAGEVLAAVGRVVELAPHTPLVPVYFFVGVMGHGATPREVRPEGGEESLGLLIPVELVGLAGDSDLSDFPDGPTVGRLDHLPWLVAHELAHVSQIALQGLEEYRRIYREPRLGVHVAYAVREGAADMVASLATDRLLPRHRYVLEHEAKLWAEFEELLHQPVSASRGWFGSAPSDRGRERPRALGYGIGWAICRHYYDRSPDRRRAMTEILSANTADDFERILAPYRDRFRRSSG